MTTHRVETGFTQPPITRFFPQPAGLTPRFGFSESMLNWRFPGAPPQVVQQVADSTRQLGVSALIGGLIGLASSMLRWVRPLHGLLIGVLAGIGVKVPNLYKDLSQNLGTLQSAATQAVNSGGIASGIPSDATGMTSSSSDPLASLLSSQGLGSSLSGQSPGAGASSSDPLASLSGQSVGATPSSDPLASLLSSAQSAPGGSTGATSSFQPTTSSRTTSIPWASMTSSPVTAGGPTTSPYSTGYSTGVSMGAPQPTTMATAQPMASMGAWLR